MRANGAGVLVVIGHVHERGLDAELGQPLGEEFRHAAVDVALRHDVIAGFQQGKNRGRDRAHARGEDAGSVGAFERGEGLLG